MTRSVKAFIFFLIFPLLLYPQSQNIKFEHISVEQGLSHGYVQSILQDHQGFIWIATEDGLNKYDGYTFTTYRHDPLDSTSLSSNYLTWIYEDPQSNLWISTVGGGLNKYNRENDNFICFMPDRDDPESIITDVIQQTVAFNYNGKMVLWIGTQSGLYKMDIATQKFKYYPHTDKGFPSSYIETMTVDSSGMVWIGSTGLQRFDPRTEQFTYFWHDPGDPYSLSDDNVLSMFIDHSGILWVGTPSGGLNKFDPETEQFTRYQHDPDNHYSLSNNWIVAINEDPTGNLWIGTALGGLNKFDKQSGQFIHYKHDPGIPNSLSDNTVMCIYEDHSGIFWVGTLQGINKFDLKESRFSNYRSLAGDQASISDSYIWSICGSSDEENEIIWVGTKTGGLNKLKRRTGKFTRYLYDSDNLQSIPSNVISALFEDRAGTLWIGSWGEGLIKFDQKEKKFTQYLNNIDKSNIGTNVIRTIFEDRSGILWIGTQEGGLYKFDRKTETFSAVGFTTQIIQIFEDQLGVLWIAAISGLKKLDRASDKYIHYLHDPTDPNSISSNKVISIHEDSSGRMWFGTMGGGLNKFERRSEQFKSYTTRDGLPNDVIQGILEDESGNLWLSTNNGLSKFNPETESFRNYDVNDGLLGNQFYPGAYYKAKDGEMYFGGARGLNSFYPDRMHNNMNIPRIVISDFKIFNKSVPVRSDSDGEKHKSYTMSKPIYLLKELELSYKENIFSLEFAALDFNGPQKNLYAYKMEGVDPDWVRSNASRRFATYTNLDPGEYTFRVKGSNNDGIWNEEGTSINVIITPPWWKTNWAYTIYFFLFALTLYAFRSYDKKRQRLKHELELEQVHAEKLEEVDRMKSRFFANISHEFRTPLTLIIGPLKQMLAGEFIGNLKDQYKMIIRNGERLLGLINQILDLSKLETGEIILKVSETDIVKYMKGIVLSFSSLAERKKIDLKMNIKDREIIGFIDVDKFEKIITNILSNAFKFTPEGGEIEVNVKIPNSPDRISRPQADSSGLNLPGFNKSPITNSEFLILNSNFVEICITNTGPGIPPDQLDKIFDRFYQASDNYKKDSEGTGIGLALTKELIEICRGEISVVSKMIGENGAEEHPPNPLAKGDLFLNTFTILLPIDKEYFKENEIIDAHAEQVNSTLSKGAKFEGLLTGGLSKTAIETIEGEVKGVISESKKSTPLILIVEDNPDVTNYICSFMKNEYRILKAENGEEGLKLVIDKYPDLIISDLMMPEMDGFELCHKIKNDERISHIPVILLTAKADLDSKIEGLEFGADDYVTKPFEARELIIRSKNLIDQRKKLREKFSFIMDLKPEDIASSSMDEQLLRRLIAVFEDHIEKSNFTTEDLAKEIGLSRMHLNRKVKALTNLSTHDFLRTLRLQRAARMLKKASWTVSEIAYKVGYNNLSHFSRAFRKQFGKLPSEFAD